MSASVEGMSHLFKRFHIPPSLHSIKQPTTATNNKTGRSRLFRVRRSVLPPLFSFRQRNQSSRHCQYFSLFTSRLSEEVLDNINKGPSWLRGAYPPGLLSGKHEKYRLINHAELKTWRTEDDEEGRGEGRGGATTNQEGELWDKARHHLALTRIPILQASIPNSNRIPGVVLSTKKKVHKDANKRRQATNKLWTALEIAIRDLQGTAQELPKDPETALVLLATKEAITASPDVLATEMRKAVGLLFNNNNNNKQKPAHFNKGPSRPNKSFSRARQY